MATVKIAGDAVIITSSLKLEEIRNVQKYRPKALVLISDEGEGEEPVFAIGFTTGSGSINEVGVSFGRVSPDGSGRASLTIFMAPAEDADIKAEVAEKFGGALMKLNKLEAQLPAVLAEIAAERARVLENIEVLP